MACGRDWALALMVAASVVASLHVAWEQNGRIPDFAEQHPHTSAAASEEERAGLQPGSGSTVATQGAAEERHRHPRRRQRAWQGGDGWQGRLPNGSTTNSRWQQELAKRASRAESDFADLFAELPRWMPMAPRRSPGKHFLPVDVRWQSLPSSIAEFAIQGAVEFAADTSDQHSPHSSPRWADVWLKLTRRRKRDDTRSSRHRTTPISTEFPAYAAFVRHSVGPDAFHVVLDTPCQLAAAATRFHNDGSSTDNTTATYVAFAQVLHPNSSIHGDVGIRVTIKWDFDEFHALDESYPTIPFSRNKVLSRAVLGGGGKGTPYSSDMRHQDCAFVRQVAMGNAALCSRGDLQAVFVSSVADRPVQALPYAPWKGSEWQLTFPGQCRLLAYSTRPESFKPPAGCRPPGQPMRVFFTGDSQVRTIFRHWVAVGVRAQVIGAKGGDILGEGLGASGTAGAAHHARYVWDPLLAALLDREDWIRENFDVLVLGFGAWPASFAQWSLAMFWAHMIEVTDLLHRLATGPSPVTVIWIGAPAWPKFRKGVSGYRITNYRLGLYNAVAEAVIHHRGRTAVERDSILIIDFFHISAPLLKCHRGDGMHYDRSVVLFSVVDVIATLITSRAGRSCQSY